MENENNNLEGWEEYNISEELEKDNVEYEKKNKKNIIIKVIPEKKMSKGELYTAFLTLKQYQEDHDKRMEIINGVDE